MTAGACLDTCGQLPETLSTSEPQRVKIVASVPSAIVASLLIRTLPTFLGSASFITCAQIVFQPLVVGSLAMFSSWFQASPEFIRVKATSDTSRVVYCNFGNFCVSKIL